MGAQINNNHQEPQNNNNELDENKIKYPLKLKWKRETIVKEIHKNGVKGDVIYYSSCGKKLRSFQEIERYILKQNVKNLTRDNFTFSSKCLIGTFLIPKEQPFNENLINNESIKKELKFYILSEEQMSLKIQEISKSDSSEIQQQKQTAFDYQQKSSNDKLKLKQYEEKAERKRLLIEKKQEEKMQQNERKIKEKWFETILNREYKKQIDDMQEKNLKEIPNFKQINGTSNIKLEENEETIKTNEIMSNYLMIIEFINNFKNQLTIDSDYQTNCCQMTYKQFYLGITNKNKKYCTQIVNLLKLFIKLLVNDYKDSLVTQNQGVSGNNNNENTATTSNMMTNGGPNGGLINNNYIRTKSGLKVNDLKLTNLNYSEVLRLYLIEKKYQQENLFSLNAFKNVEYSDLSYLNEAYLELEFLLFNLFYTLLTSYQKKEF